MLSLDLIKRKEKSLHAILIRHGVNEEIVRKRIIVELFEEVFKA